jgi:hypothetical protein
LSLLRAMTRCSLMLDSSTCPYPPQRTPVAVQVRQVTPGYLRAMGIPVLGWKTNVAALQCAATRSLCRSRTAARGIAVGTVAALASARVMKTLERIRACFDSHLDEC